jgi:hypothetical protein
MKSQGVPLVEDICAAGEVANGCGYAVRTVHDGVRSTSADFLTKLGNGVDILLNTIIDKVNLTAKGESLVASSVDVLSKDKERRTIKARREIVISGGMSFILEEFVS